jgi:hypothetical protein
LISPVSSATHPVTTGFSSDFNAGFGGLPLPEKMSKT